MKTSKTAKDTISYWNNAIFHKDGNPTWCMRCQVMGERRFTSLGTSNRAAAAQLARDIYLSARTSSWEDAIDSHAPWAMHSRLRAERKRKMDVDSITIGAVVTATAKAADLDFVRKTTARNYINALRRIAAGIAGVPESRGNRRLLAIDRLPISILTAKAVETWRVNYISAAGTGYGAKRSRQESAASTIQHAKNCFGEHSRQCAEFDFPAEIPLLGVRSKHPGGRGRHRSLMPIADLMHAASTQLKNLNPEAYKIFLLGLAGGLRAGEIDQLRWGALCFDTNTIALHESAYMVLKTAGSERPAPIDPWALAEIRALTPPERQQDDAHVVHFAACQRRQSRRRKTPPSSESSEPIAANPARLNISAKSLRARPHFHYLTRWLRANGLEGIQKPIHYLRKEYGSLVCAQLGIHAAMKCLRHTQITTTQRYYLDESRPALNILPAPKPAAREVS